jgi:uncharacterized Zn finger protein
VPASWGSDGGGGGGGDFFPPSSTPRKVKGGIRARASRGPIGQTWWSRRWLAVLEALGVGQRLQRGRAYARQGQVISLDIELGGIRASVQGTRRTPYEAQVRMATLSQGEWALVAEALAGQAVFRARLLGGEMPDDIETVFAAVGVSLFPTIEGDLRFSCSCPDWADPCKHVAAACYLVGEAFDRDPFLAFRLRGMERDVLLAMVAGHAARQDGEQGWARSEPGAGVGADEAGHAPAGGADDRRAEPGALDVAAFWGGEGSEESAEPAPIDLQPPPADAPLIRVLGPLPMWRGGEDFEAAFARVYGMAVGERALDVALGQGPPPSAP